jgi:glycopeptide antibiotics resistance protein
VVSTYLLPVTTALYLFPLIVLVVMLPVAFVSYRRRGRAGGWATVVSYSFLFYLLAIALQTVIPLPRNANYCSGHTYASSPQLRPFYFVQVIKEHAHHHWGLLAILHNTAIWSAGLNVVMLLPLGVFLRYAYRMRVVSTTVIGFGVSFFFELTQLTGLWFVYPCPYRLFSVDDMILNTTGVLIGWLVGGLLVKVLPTLEPDGDRRRYADKVTFTRRLFAVMADGIGFAALIAFGFGLLTLFGQSREHRGLPVVILALVWFVLVPALTGSTPGKWAMLLRIERTSGRHAGPVALLVRAVVLLSPVWLLCFGLTADSWGPAGWVWDWGILLGLGVLALVMAVWVLVAVVLDEDNRGPHERLSGTVNAAVVDRPARPEPRKTGGKAITKASK